MIDLFRSFAGDLTGMPQDLILVLAAVFALFGVVSFVRILELMIDFIFRRKK